MDDSGRQSLLDRGFQLANQLLAEEAWFQEAPGLDVIPGDFTGPVDARLVDAVIELESGWDPSAVSPHGAVGLGQMMESGKEWTWFRRLYESVMGGRPLSFEEFAGNPELQVAGTVVGLAGNRSVLEQRNPPIHDWFLAAANYFGAPPEDLGRCDLVDNEGTCIGATGYTYIQRLEEIVAQRYGKSAVDELHAGTSRPAASTGRSLTGDVRKRAVAIIAKILGIKEEVIDRASSAVDVLDAIAAVITDKRLWLGMGMILAALGVFQAGLAARNRTTAKEAA